MFREQPGFAGVLFAANLDERAVITFWRDAASARTLEESESYKSTVTEIEAAGFLHHRKTLTDGDAVTQRVG